MCFSPMCFSPLCFSPMRVNRTIRLGGQFTLVHSMSAPGVNKLLVSLIDSVLHNTAINSKLQHVYQKDEDSDGILGGELAPCVRMYALQCEPCFSVRLSGNLNKNCCQRNSSSALLRKELHKVLTKWMCPVLENNKIDPIVQIHICNFEQMPVSACLV